MRRDQLLPFVLIPLVALTVVLPLIAHGCSCGHDFDFHLISWMEAAAQFKAGVWHPSWAFSPAWNAGEPRFVFYPPLSWTLGAALGMVFPWGGVPVVYTWLALVAAGFAMYCLARALDGSEAHAVLAAAVYVANPYMIFTAYERTAYAELLAAVWLPLLLASVLRRRVTVLGVALPVALLWLTNAPAAVMGCYALALLALVRLAYTWRSLMARSLAGVAARLAGGVTLGIALAAFYVLPAAYERRWVQIAMALISGMRIEDNFLFHHTGDALHDQVLRTASIVATGMLVGALVALMVAASRVRADGVFKVQKRVLISIGVLIVAIGFMLTPLSARAWSSAPEMAFLQFPWRLTAVLTAALCGMLPLAMGPVRMKPVLLCVAAVAIAAGLSWPLVPVFRQVCDDEDNVAARRAVFVANTGTDPTDEYTSGDADNDALLHANPPSWLAEDANAQPPQHPAGPVPLHFEIAPVRAEMLVLNLRDYPAWVVRVNGIEEKERVTRNDGLIAFPVAAGRSRIDIAYGVTRDRKLGDGVTLAALLASMALAAAGRLRDRSRIIENG